MLYDLLLTFVLSFHHSDPLGRAHKLCTYPNTWMYMLLLQWIVINVCNTIICQICNKICNHFSLPKAISKQAVEFQVPDNVVPMFQVSDAWVSNSSPNWWCLQICIYQHKSYCVHMFEITQKWSTCVSPTIAYTHMYAAKNAHICGGKHSQAQPTVCQPFIYKKNCITWMYTLWMR